MLKHARIADVNGDGAKEILLAVNNTIEVRNAMSGVLVKTYTFGNAVKTFELAALAGPEPNRLPTVIRPAAAVVECGVSAELTAQVSDPEGVATVVVWTRNGETIQTDLVTASAPGTVTNVTISVGFPLGTNLLAVGVTDGTNAGSCTTTVTVVDTTPPVITNVVAVPNVLWPPDHKMVRVDVRAYVGDSCSAADWRIVRVRSNEPANGRGDGNTSADWRITGDHALLLRAERSGKGNGRVYYTTVQATDASGNVSQTRMVAVTEPKSQGKGESLQPLTPTIPGRPSMPRLPPRPQLPLLERVVSPATWRGPGGGGARP
jgi:hypothetical protein